MLGFLHKRSLRQCHPLIVEMLPLAAERGLQGAFHDKALYAYSEQVSSHRRLYDRSLFMYIHMYNRLPQVLVDSQSVKDFQARLTNIVRVRASRNQETWRRSFQDQQDLIDMLCGQ